jgi:hypothetical protein
MRHLEWSQNKAGTLNGKVGHITLFTVTYYPERGYFVAPKLPGLNKTIPVNSEEAGKREAEAIYQRYFDFLNGAEWLEPAKVRNLMAQFAIKIAKSAGKDPFVEEGFIDLTELVKSIQQSEWHPDCFRLSVVACDQMHCPWWSLCLDQHDEAKIP